MAEREKLADWLRQPEGALRYDDLVWHVAQGRVALSIENCLDAVVIETGLLRSMQAQLPLVDALTDTQRGLLAFLAGLVSSPPVRWNSGTYRALRRRGLIEYNERDRWHATSLGEKTALELVP